MDIAEIEKRLIALDAEVHKILQYVARSKKLDVEKELKEYEELVKRSSKKLKGPFDPTAEIRQMREKEYLV